MAKRYASPAVEVVLFRSEGNFLASNGIKGDFKNNDQVFFDEIGEDDEFA